MLTSWRWEIFAHFMISGRILVWRWIFNACRILEWWLVNISLEERIADRHSAKFGINWSFDDILRLFGVCIVILGPRIVYSVQISVRFEPICHRIEDSFCLGAWLDLSEVLNHLTFFKWRPFVRPLYLFNRGGWSIEYSNLPVLFLYRVFLIVVGIELWALWDEFERWGLILGHIDLHFIVSWAER